MATSTLAAMTTFGLLSGWFRRLWWHEDEWMSHVLISSAFVDLSSLFGLRIIIIRSHG